MPKPLNLTDNRPIKVYVAGPISKGNTGNNVRAGIDAAEALVKAGMVPYLPHTTHFWHMIHPHDHAEWLELDFEWLRVCDAVLRLPGESVGADKETAEACRLGIPVYGFRKAVGERYDANVSHHAYGLKMGVNRIRIDADKIRRRTQEDRVASLELAEARQAEAKKRAEKERDDAFLKITAERDRRFYYQDIVLSVCSSLDRLFGISTICGCPSNPSRNVQDRMAKVETELKALRDLSRQWELPPKKPSQMTMAELIADAQNTNTVGRP